MHIHWENLTPTGLVLARIIDRHAAAVRRFLLRRLNAVDMGEAQQLLRELTHLRAHPPIPSIMFMHMGGPEVRVARDHGMSIEKYHMESAGVAIAVSDYSKEEGLRHSYIVEKLAHELAHRFVKTMKFVKP